MVASIRAHNIHPIGLWCYFAPWASADGGTRKGPIKDISTKGCTGAQRWWTIPADDQWHEHTWRIGDASFVGQWGYNFRFDAVSSPGEFLVREVRVTKAIVSAK